MPKKAGAKKKISIKKAIPTKTKPKKIQQNTNVENVLVENFISLQKVMTNLAMKFDNLSIQISKLLELFEISAKTLAQKDIRLDKGEETKEGKKVVEKLDNLLDQNKIIARGLTLLHESPEPISPPQLMRQPTPQQPMLSQRPPMPLQPSPVKQVVEGQYQKSILIKDQEASNPKPIKFAKKNEKVF